MSNQKRRRTKGDGSIYKVSKTSKGKIYTYWEAKYKSPQMKNPKIERAKTEIEAKRLLKKMKEDAVKNDYIEIQKISVEEYMNNWLNTIMRNKLKDRSFDVKEYTVQSNVIPYIGNIQLGSINSNDIQNMINELSEKKSQRSDDTLSFSTIKKAYEAVNACFKLAVIKSDMLKNPCLGVSLPEKKKKQKSDIRYFNDEEIKAITEASLLRYPNNYPYYRLGWGVIFLMYTGLRIGEFLALTWEDIDFENKTVTIDKNVVRAKNREEENEKKYKRIFQDDTKTTSSLRVVQLSNSAIKAAEELKKINGDFKYISSTSKGNIIHERAFDRMFRAILVRAGIKPTGVHSLRHTFASMLFRKNIDVLVISKLLGHKSVQITYDVYLHLIEEQKRQAISVLDEL